MNKLQAIAQLFLRLALGIGYLVPSFDRLGIWGKYGEKQITWGDWTHFMDYAYQIMQFLPKAVIPVFAVIATIAEISIGILLLLGLWTRFASMASFLLALSFALSMTISFGIVSPLSYSVFVVSASSLLLFTLPNYKFSLNNFFKKKN